MAGAAWVMRDELIAKCDNFSINNPRNMMLYCIDHPHLMELSAWAWVILIPVAALVLGFWAAHGFLPKKSK
jgi:uncharacterized BrkB/YihY/UPF0761 family membrane protein